MVIAPTGRPEPHEPRRLLDRGIDLGDAPVELGHGLALNGQAHLDVSGSARERQINGYGMFEVGARQEPEHADRVQARQHVDHRDQHKPRK